MKHHSHGASALTEKAAARLMRPNYVRALSDLKKQWGSTASMVGVAGGGCSGGVSIASGLPYSLSRTIATASSSKVCAADVRRSTRFGAQVAAAWTVDTTRHTTIVKIRLDEPSACLRGFCAGGAAARGRWGRGAENLGPSTWSYEALRPSPPGRVAPKPAVLEKDLLSVLRMP